MGSDAEVFLFDHGRYLDEVVPAVVGLVRTATIEAPWFAWYTAYEPEGMAVLREHRVDLERHCTFLGPDLRYLDDSHGSQFCRSVDRPVRDRCPLHEASADTVGYVVEGAFQKAVALRCLGPSQFVGRSRRALDFREVLREFGVPAEDRLRELVEALGLRATTLGSGDGGGFEGIHGWLTGEETVGLALHLDELPLPRYEPSFEEMEALRSRFAAEPDQAALPYSWEELRLSFVRTTAFIAADQGKGLLWGNEVVPEVTRNYAAHFERVRVRTGEGL